MATAIAEGGQAATEAYAAAFALASVSGGDAEAGLVQASAEAFCSGGGEASAFSKVIGLR